MIVFLQLLLSLNISAPNVQVLRLAYFETAQDQQKSPALKKAVENYPVKDQYFYFYLSAYNRLLSRNTKMSDKKIAYFNLCKRDMDNNKVFILQNLMHWPRMIVKNVKAF